ncbi:hypothetical protein LUZ60_011238 [Juncus effusus]|nr:hypothetical protein LUZ60_011238 [Juncus effusus]
MLASAKWIAKYAIPCLNKAKEKFPHYEIKIMGHSMGAGIAAILTQILREKKELSSCICLAFAPAACMTWDLAESGKGFITSLVNKTDAVPSFSKISAEILRTEVGLSWENEMKDKNRTPLNAIYKLFKHQLNFIQSCWARSEITDNDVVLCPERNITQVGTSTKSSQSHSSNIDLKFVNNFRYFTTFQRNSKIVTRKSTELHFGPPLKDNKQLYPPGRIIHMVSLQDRKFGIYENPRDLYGKMRVASNMIRDHYMPDYIETLELLIDEHGK